MVQFVSYLSLVLCKQRQKTLYKTYMYFFSCEKRQKRMQNYCALRKWKRLPQSDCPAYSPVREAKTGISSVSPAYRGIKMGWLWGERPLITPVIPVGGGGGMEFQMTGVLIHFSNSCKKLQSVFQWEWVDDNKQCKYEKRNWNPFSKVMRKRNTKNEIQIRFLKSWENEKQKLKFKSPFQSAAKTKSENQIRFSMSQVDKKRKIEMGMEFHFTRPKKNEK